MRPAVKTFQSAVQNLLHEAVVKVQVGSSMIWKVWRAKKKDKSFQIREPVMLGLIDTYLK